MHRTPNSYDTKGDSVESTDSGMYIQTGKGFGYPPVISTEPEYAAKVPEIDIDSETEGPQISNYVGTYCEDNNKVAQMYM